MSKHDLYRAKCELSPLLRTEQVAELLGCSTKHVQNLYKAGTFPSRTRVSERIIGWRESDIEAWLLNQREERDNV